VAPYLYSPVCLQGVDKENFIFTFASICLIITMQRKTKRLSISSLGKFIGFEGI
jgi:hypothetical protein